jgi:lysophospholipase L1-like esterase
MTGFSVKKKITVYTIGDSTMANKDTVGNPERGWAMALPLFFDSAEVVTENHAVNGRSTKSFIDEGRWDVILKTLKKGDYVFIQFGHNDEKQEQPSLYAAPYGAYTGNLTRCVRETQAKGAFPVLMTSIVRRHFDGNGRLKHTHGDYPDAVRKLASKLKIPVIDMEAKSRQLIQDLGDSASMKLFMNLDAGLYPKFPQGKKDDTHLQWNGAKIIAALAVEGIKEQKLPLAKYLKTVLFEKNGTAYIYIGKDEMPVVRSAFEMLQSDVRAVFDADLQLTGNKMEAQIIVSSSDGELQGKWEAFQINVQDDKLLVSGSDARGTAYGLLEISRMIGVSPWVWWADATPEKRDLFLLSDVKESSQSPSVQYRGIFLNDEDWALMPWSTRTFEPAARRGAIGPKTYSKIFELLLRLRANTIWPAMHECTVPFFFVEGNREAAEKYGIVLSTSHAEPMMRTNTGEWNTEEFGAFNFLTNRDRVLSYWEERAKQLTQTENIYTVGMRGIHDGRMQGVKTLDDETDVLRQVIEEQRNMLKRNNPDKKITDIPQVFVPYKEVLKAYDNGLKLPEDVTLVWCDDNNGYIMRLSNPEEQKRPGGGGVYYHISYWGKPHDYLWLASTQPGLIYAEMKRAWDSNARRLWILNAGDIKPGEYLTEFFLDMAWNIDAFSGDKIYARRQQWIKSIFGDAATAEIDKIMHRYYRLAGQRKPEHLGWNRVEDYSRAAVEDTGFSPFCFGDETERRIGAYSEMAALSAQVYEKQIPEQLKPAYFQLVHYPVAASAAMNRKMLYAQKSRHYAGKDIELAGYYARLATGAYNEIAALDYTYNRDMLNGKWELMMDMKPRDLPVFQKPALPQLPAGVLYSGHRPALPEAPALVETAGTPVEGDRMIALNACNFVNKIQTEIIEGLGHSGKTVRLPAAKKIDTSRPHLEYRVTTTSKGDVKIKTGTIPMHPVHGNTEMRYAIVIDRQEPVIVSTAAAFLSDKWAENVLRNQSLTVADAHIDEPGEHTIRIYALDEELLIDQLMLEFDLERKHYLILKSWI